MSDDPPDSNKSLRDRVRRYLEASANHREKIPFLFINHYDDEFPDAPPEWINERDELKRYWEIARTLALLYSFPLREGKGESPGLFEHAERYQARSTKPDRRLYELTADTDHSYSDWCRAMETYLEMRRVNPDS